MQLIFQTKIHFYDIHKKMFKMQLIFQMQQIPAFKKKYKSNAFRNGFSCLGTENKTLTICKSLV